MKIALIQEFSQAAKNALIEKTLRSVAEPLGHTVFNTGMQQLENSFDRPEDYSADNPRLTYLHIGIQAALLLNSGAVDFVVTGCGTGQGALMSCNMYPGVCCGYCIEPTDAYLFLQINDGNALSIPFAKGFGWGGELNLENIFMRAFSSPKGQGYPSDRKEAQNNNVQILNDVKRIVTKPLIESLRTLDSELVCRALTKPFLDCFYTGCTDQELESLVRELVAPLT
ncbi:RpiB/LacA/LacB family sugar-phosphate isomerase [Collinsella sp. zg1085]|uniref:RpiB/LacA/LacB family sugar-phosphate isomerase n=1 Tax=Collinsella sp. zg1085 TaxID=2844380 RepID=UPI001C0CB7F9|nr:RpiB/LacA/LacB family sugar-phosphate isomerase [Collinsella sp. zg1085]QWT17417.1 RpiB/LacA/LacB family sugar-phosphate isomerase [Collinsella sp. zg1085]